MSDNCAELLNLVIEMASCDGPQPRFIERCRAAITAQYSTVQNKDWVLVPREITQAMLDATCSTDAHDRQMRAAWSELLRTAPQSPFLATPATSA